MSIHLSDPDLEPDFYDDPDGPFGAGPAIDDLEPLYDPNYDSFLDGDLFADPFGARRFQTLEYSIEDEGWPYPD